MNINAKIYIAGHRGMVGSAIVRKLVAGAYQNLLMRSSAELDLRDQRQVQDFFRSERPEYVFLAAAKVGGIHANNTFRADFIYQNLAIECNVIHAAHEFGVKKLLFLGSSCIYPKFAPQPIKEEYLLSAALEASNEPYAIAKIAGLKMCEAYRTQYNSNFISVMPTNLYGPNDDYDLLNSHVLPALLRKFHEAKKNGSPFVEVWGTGSPMREFLHVDDLADACHYLMLNYEGDSFLNIGTGKDISIKDLAFMIKEITAYQGEIVFDEKKPDGTPRKLLDVSKIQSIGWKHRIGLREGIEKVYSEISENVTW